MNQKMPFVIYSESTPNPSVMKFVANQILTENARECLSVQDTKEKTLLRKLFSFPFVKEIFISNNYISIKKHNAINWLDVTNQIRIFIQDDLNNQTQIDILNIKTPKSKKNKTSKLMVEIEKTIDLSIRPGIQMDGGDIEIISCDYNYIKNKTEFIHKGNINISLLIFNYLSRLSYIYTCGIIGSY